MALRDIILLPAGVPRATTEYAEADAEATARVYAHLTKMSELNKAMEKKMKNLEYLRALRPLAYRVARLVELGREMLDGSGERYQCPKCGLYEERVSPTGKHWQIPACRGNHELKSDRALRRLAWLYCSPKLPGGEACDVDSPFLPDHDAPDAWQPSEDLLRRVFLVVSDAIRAVDMDSAHPSEKRIA